jgi:hypothetical protein
MFKSFRKSLATLLSGAMLAVVPMAVPVVAFAQAPATTDNPISNNVACGVNLNTSGATSGSNCTDTSAGNTKIQSIVTTVINIFSIIVGIISVIMIIFGGFKYITSGGDSGNVSGAKNTILYAVIGLVVVALAQFIVQFVLNRVTTTST